MIVIAQIILLLQLFAEMDFNTGMLMFKNHASSMFGMLLIVDCGQSYAIYCSLTELLS